MARGRLFFELVALTLIGVLFVAGAILAAPGNLLYLIAKALFEQIDGESA